MNAKGSAFLYVRREPQDLIEALIMSWGYHATPDIATGSHFIDYLQWTGTKDPTAALTVPTAIQFMKDHDWDHVRRRCHLLPRQAIERICDLTELPSLHTLDSEFYSQTGIAPLPPTDLAVLKSRLYNEHKIEVPFTRWQDQYFVRISIPGYNTQPDMDAFLEALKILLPQTSI
jgi:isopenicillin-N epimerase